jgi:hypothetical protein
MFCEDGETRISIGLEKLETDYAQKWSKMSPEEQYQYRDGTTVDVEVVYELQQTPTFICSQYMLDMLGTQAKVGERRCRQFFMDNKHRYRRAVEQKCMCDRCYEAEVYYESLTKPLYSARGSRACKKHAKLATRPQLGTASKNVPQPPLWKSVYQHENKSCQ